MAQGIAGSHFVGEVCQKVFIEQEGKVLMCRHIDSSFWDFPGGRLHKDEDIEAGLLREVKEEIGVDIVIGDPINARLVVRDTWPQPRYLITFLAQLKDPTQPFVLAPDEIAEVKWVSLADLETIDMPDGWRSLIKTRLNGS